jgi:hypothetical protein
MFATFTTEGWIMFWIALAALLGFYFFAFGIGYVVGWTSGRQELRIEQAKVVTTIIHGPGAGI